MSWENLKVLTRVLPVLNVAGVKVNGPGKLTTGPAPATGTLRINPHQLETKAGGPAQPPSAEAAAFAKKQQLAVRSFTVDDTVRTRRWFNDAMTQSKNNLDAFVTATVQQLNKGVSEQSLAEAQAVINELGRTAQGADAVRKQVTAAAVARTINISKGRK
jgi:hypothetical protein